MGKHRSTKKCVCDGPGNPLHSVAGALKKCSQDYTDCDLLQTPESVISLGSNQIQKATERRYVLEGHCPPLPLYRSLSLAGEGSSLLLCCHSAMYTVLVLPPKGKGLCKSGEKSHQLLRKTEARNQK